MRKMANGNGNAADGDAKLKLCLWSDLPAVLCEKILETYREGLRQRLHRFVHREVLKELHVMFEFVHGDFRLLLSFFRRYPTTYLC